MGQLADVARCVAGLSSSSSRVHACGGSTLLAPAGPDATIDRDLGGILPLRVESPTFGTLPVHLRFTEAQKAQIFHYLAERCGLGTHQDPLNAP